MDRVIRAHFVPICANLQFIGVAEQIVIHRSGRTTGRKMGGRPRQTAWLPEIIFEQQVGLSAGDAALPVSPLSEQLQHLRGAGGTFPGLPGRTRRRPELSLKV